MAHKTNFKNRSPYICAAGRPTPDHVPVKECLKHYPLEDQVNALKHEAHIPDKSSVKYKLPRLKNHRNVGIYTGVKTTMYRPSVETRFQTLINDLKETTYKSYWDAEDGRPKDPVGNLPSKIDRYETTFGLPSVKEYSVRELVNPDIKYEEILENYVKGHELYRKSHNSYYPSERANRKYKTPAYDPNRMYGERKGIDPRGLMAKCIINNSAKEKYGVVNTILADHQNLNVPKVGEVLAPLNTKACVPEGHIYGRPSIKEDSIAELLNENEIAPIKPDIEILFAFINPLRRFLKNRFNQNLFSFRKFRDSLKYYDQDQTGWIPLEILYKICSCYKLFYNKFEVERFLRLYGIIQGDKINYQKYVDVLDWQVGCPEIGESYHVPDPVQYYESTYQGALKDYLYMDNSGHRTAGIGSVRYDIPVPTVPENGCRAYKEHLGAETDAKTLMCPSVYTAYGLTFYDFFQPRQKDVIRKIFTNVGYKLDDETFEKLWNEGVEIDGTCLVCPETFKQLIKKHNIEYVKEETKS